MRYFKTNYFHIENNYAIGQEEKDFEEAFKQIFKKKYIPNEIQDEYLEFENQIYYLKKNNNNYIIKEEPNQIAQKILNFKFDLKFIPIEKKFEFDEPINIININEEKEFNDNDTEQNIQTNFAKKDNKICAEDNLYYNEDKKIETNNYVTNDIDKQNKFRVYSLNDFNLFHPGGTVEYYKQIREDINDEICKQLREENKKYFNISKFKIHKERNKKTKRKVKERKKRKEKPDDVRKKIKSRFLKATKNRVNQMLKIAKSKEFFDFLPQSFICNISKQKNKDIINMTFKELMSQKFFEEVNIKNDNNKNFLQKKRNPDKKKYDKNIKVLKYLDKNYEICRKSNFNVIGDMTFKDIFNEYLKSEEFEKEIEKLKDEQNSEKYIKDYIIKAYNFIHYFSKPI